MLAKIKQFKVKLVKTTDDFESKLKEEFKNFVCNTDSGAVEIKVMQALEDQHNALQTLFSNLHIGPEVETPQNDFVSYVSHHHTNKLRP